MNEPLTQALSPPRDMDSGRYFTAAHRLGDGLIGEILDNPHQDRHGLFSRKLAYGVVDFVFQFLSL